MIKVSLKDVFNSACDNMTTFTLSDNSIRGAFFDGTTLVRQMRAQHNLGILESLCLGHACLCVALFIPMMKGYERVIFTYKSDGKIPGFSVEASSEGWVRGYLFESEITLNKPLESWNLESFFGEGFLTVSRFKEGAKTPISGSVKITHKNIAKDLSEYFLKSEQTQTAINSSIKFDKAGNIETAAALFLQAMPGAENETLELASKKFESLDSLAEILKNQASVKACINYAFGDLEPLILISRNVEFNCPCSRERFLSKIKALPLDELKSLAEKEEIEVICNNCSSVYHYKKNEFLS